MALERQALDRRHVAGGFDAERGGHAVGNWTSRARAQMTALIHEVHVAADAA
jgi:hypothetical protein